MPATLSGVMDRRFRFGDWRNPEVPRVSAGVYAVWRHDTQLIYIGMSGRNIEAHQGSRPYGLVTRLGAHASGRLSGDQFCVYIANRFVIPDLTQDQLPLFATGELRLDSLTKQYIHQHLTYDFILIETGCEARDLERQGRTGELLGTKPWLNPL